MRKNNIENYDKLMKLKNKYGYYFAMGAVHLIDKGYKAVMNMTDEELEEFRVEQTKIQKKQEENGIITVMTADFMVDLWKIAKEIANASTPVDLVKFLAQEIFE